MSNLDYREVFSNYGEDTLFHNNILRLKELYKDMSVTFENSDFEYFKKACDDIIKDFYCTYALTKKFNVSSHIVKMYVDFENTIVNPLIERGIANVSK